VTFEVTNKGSRVTEFYLYGEGDRVMGVQTRHAGRGNSRRFHRQWIGRQVDSQRGQGRQGRRGQGAGYNFTGGSDTLGHLDAGLFFIAFNRDTSTQVRAHATQPVHVRQDDGIRRTHRLRPPGTTPGTSWGHTLVS
jgi:hypothetical protein